MYFTHIYCIELVSNTSKVSSIIFSTFAKERFDVAVAAQSRVAPGWDGRTAGGVRARPLSSKPTAAAADGRTSVLRALLGRRGCLGAAVTHMPLLE